MRKTAIAIVLLLGTLSMMAQSIYRRGSFPFVFQSDSSLTSDYFYSANSCPKDLFLLKRVFVGGSNTGSFDTRATVAPGFGFHSGKWRGEVYLAADAYNLISSGQKGLETGWYPYESTHALRLIPGGVVKFQANQHFSFAGGYDKNFIGEGFYSLFLSDNANKNAFFRANAKFWKIDYSILYSYYDNLNSFRNLNQFPSNKFTVTHYLKVKATKWLEFGFFETIIWQERDKANYRGFDLNYLNPVAYFRPIEFNSGSADNAMVGAGINIKPISNLTLYSQVLLDEFLLKEIKADQGWWANKYGAQAGMKYFDAFGIDGLSLLGELNFVRPFTYTHSSNNNNYGHNYAALAHPWGANFYQAVFQGQYQQGKSRVQLGAEVGRKGLDPDSLSFGGNIFKPYTLRDHDYGNTLAQGQQTTMASFNILYAYKLNGVTGLEAFVNPVVTKFGADFNYGVKIGVRTPFFNSYPNH